MARESIQKEPAYAGAANMPDYEAEKASFTWQAAREKLVGLPDGKLNIAYEAIDQHLANGNGDSTAIRWIAKNGERSDFSYRDLVEQTAKFANVLRSLGINKGDRVYSLLGRVPELYIAALGTLKAGSVFCPMFSAFGPEPIQARLEIGDGKVLVTSKALYRRKVAGIRDRLPDLKEVLLIDGDGSVEGTRDLAALMAEAPSDFAAEPMAPDDMALLHFTSGTTGKPKGAVHVHEAVVAHKATGRIALDLRPGDIYWCTADPGWVTGTSYGIIAPLANGVTMIIDQAEFDADRWYQILEREKVTVWYTAPTAIRMLMKAGADMARARDLSNLRFMASVGEPLNPEAVIWGQDVFGMPFHDNWWQTETGGIMIANYASMDVKPGSMGKPLPGIAAGIVAKTPEGAAEVTEPMVIGELAPRNRAGRR
jgi:acetyl-CoA synthetase